MAVEGSEKVIAQLHALEHLDLAEMQLAVMKKIYEESQIKVPVDTGDLKNSGEFDKDKVSYGSDHSIYVEFGTYKMAAQPYLRPAYEENRYELTLIAAKETNAAIKEAI